MEQTGIKYKTTGCTWLQSVSEVVGFPLDQVNFLACQSLALLAAFWFRLYLSPQHVSPLVRHAVAALLGMSFIVFCFGWYSLHIFMLVFSCYCIMIKANADNIHRYSLMVAMGYLTICQISRAYIFSYGILSTDFSGPLMILTQKITMLAFQVHDGMCGNPGELTAEQKRLAVPSKPCLVEYLSYNLNFLSVLVGPCSSYKDYVEFIEGRHIRGRLSLANGKQSGQDSWPEPSPMRAVTHKLLVCLVCLFLFLTLTRALPIAHNIDPQFLSEASFMSRLTYAFFSVQAARPKFYFAWTLSDAINNAAGYGFKGVDKNGLESWDLISNLNILGIEMATSFKTFIDNWNIQTGVWLKCVCYDRAPRNRMALTFLLSAVWHGVYPGYYFTFLTGIPITQAARIVRRNFRHHFLSSAALKLGYDVLTWAATQLAISYTVMPFLLLATEPSMRFYSSMYFHFHIISILVVISGHLVAGATKRHSYQAHHSNNNVKEN
uniref:Membrane bound O-acyltransferase domain containing 1 n=1 Tax=Paramormyrops kingsleyae TaxID=1676925 RepID=A0A3B3Q9I9_9TELE|nr:lysophospholipid acyltransferase 1 [Paramormyrops kingsleyae]